MSLTIAVGRGGEAGALPSTQRRCGTAGPQCEDSPDPFRRTCATRVIVTGKGTTKIPRHRNDVYCFPNGLYALSPIAGGRDTAAPGEIKFFNGRDQQRFRPASMTRVALYSIHVDHDAERYFLVVVGKQKFSGETKLSHERNRVSRTRFTIGFFLLFFHLLSFSLYDIIRLLDSQT